MKIKYGLILLLSFLLMSFNVTALASQDGANAGGGGQVSKPDLSYIVVEEGACVTIVVAGVDIEKCTLSEASPQSGLQAWICPPTVDYDGNTDTDEIVICNDATAEGDTEDDDK